jgi:hypothetical protein
LTCSPSKCIPFAPYGTVYFSNKKVANSIFGKLIFGKVAFKKMFAPSSTFSSRLVLSNTCRLGGRDGLDVVEDLDINGSDDLCSSDDLPLDLDNF